MHRLAAALFLLCFAWSQAFAAQCPVFPAGGAAHHDVASAHAGHGAPAEHPHSGGEHRHDGPAPHHADGICPMAAACGVAAAPSAATGADLPHLPPAAAFFAPSDPHATPYLGSDPPPPRRG
jgi:hypothetical protein